MLPLSCNDCPIYNSRKNYVGPDGLMLSGVLIVGEAPGDVEMREGKPFVGQSGKLLDSLLRKAGLAREAFAVDNVIHCRPQLHSNDLKGTWYERSAIEHCRPNLDDTIARLKPKVILALGNVPLERLCGVTGITRYRGYPLRGPMDTWVVPTFHPSYLLPRRGQKSTSHLTPAVIHDFKRALDIAQHGFARPVATYLEDPSPTQALVFADEYFAALAMNPETYLSWDIETPYKLKVKDEESLKELDTTIVRISFCFRPGYAMSIPWTPDYMLVIRRLLGGVGPKLTWNGWHFDEPAVRFNDVAINGRSHDGRWAWHYYQPDLPAGLETVGSYWFNGLPWKHESKARPAWYSAVDPDAALQNFLGTKKGLIKDGLWEGYNKYYVDLQPYLEEAGDNGILIDRRARRVLYKKTRRIENALLREIQPFVPLDVHPRKRYKRFPIIHDGKRTIEPVEVRGTHKVCTVCGATGVTQAKHTARKGGKGTVPLNACYKAVVALQEGIVTEYNVVMDFNPASDDQLIAYIQYNGHPVGKHPKTGAPTVDDGHLKTLENKYGEKFPVYSSIRKLNRVQKTISTYIVGFKPNANGKVVTVYSNTPATGRLSSKGIKHGDDKGVNLQNVSKREENPYSEDIRRMIVPPPGHVFIEADSSAIEAVITGHLMGDAQFIEIAKKSIYAYLVCRAIGLTFDDDAVRIVKKSHKALYDKKKRTMLGLLYGMGAYLMATLYPEMYRNKNDAQAEIDFIYEMLPKLAAFHHECRIRAHQDAFLRNGWGYMRRFHDVFKYVRDKQGNVMVKDDGTPKIALGEDGKACVAQLPQSSAAFFIRENALNIAREIKARQLPFQLPGTWLIHDAVKLIVPDDPQHIEVATELLVRHLVRPIPQLNGLVVGCEVSVGHNWCDMRVVKVVKV